MPEVPAMEWQVAGACNYDCSYCIQSPKYRKGRSELEKLERAIQWFAALEGVWELKCSGGEAFAHPLFLEFVVPALMERTRHHISVLTNFSASPAQLEHFAQLTRGRLRVFSASLHLESVQPEAFVEKAVVFAQRIGATESMPFEDGFRDTFCDVSPETSPHVSPRFVINQVVLPGKEEEAARCKVLVEAAGLRWFPQLYKTKAGVADYPDTTALRALIGENPGPQQANLSPSYQGRRCQAGVLYAVVDKDGGLWSCRSARRYAQGYLGNIYVGTAQLWRSARRCPYDRCPCTVPANRGMIEGVPAP